ncbi:hypothetical protein [Niabella ginsengisoli]|uniref:hypothetical protein n=1 Tax=Niabella ginsengisoli TaxID=522298 RepID=UPI00374DEB09
MPGYIYAKQQSNVYVNLYVSSETIIKTENDNQIKLVQQTDYPWKGKINISVDPTTDKPFSIKLRIPGWATGNENNYGLYISKPSEEISISVNQMPYPVNIVDGYVTLKKV